MAKQITEISETLTLNDPDLDKGEDIEADTEEIAPSEKETPTSKEEEEVDDTGKKPDDKAEIEESNKPVVDEIDKPKVEDPVKYAMRKEIERLRKLAVSTRKNDITLDLTAVSAPIDKKEEEDDFAGYDPEEIQKFETIWEKIAKKKGYVKKDDILSLSFKESGDVVLDEFLEKHPEYQPQNDKDNLLWGQFASEYNLYVKPKSVKELKNILNRVHQSLNPKTPVNLASAAAKGAKLKATSSGGASFSSNSRKPNVTPADPSLKQYLKGFTDEDLKEMGF